MSLSNFVALRYLQSHGKNRFFSWITFLSISGMAIGVATLIVVISVINGFEVELRNRFLNANAHIMAYRYPAGMSNPEKWEQLFYKDFGAEIRGVAPFIHYETMLKKGSIMQGVLVRGIHPQKRENVQSMKELINPLKSLDLLQKEIDEQLPDVPGIIIGKGLLGIIDAKIGDTVFLISPTQDKDTELAPFKIIGTYNSGLKHYDNRLVAMSLSAAKRFFKMGEIVTGLEIGIDDPDKSIEITEKFQRKYNLTFREWQSFNRPLFEAMEKEKTVIALIVALVTLVAAFNILTTIFVSVSQKQKDISVLKALGANNRQIVGLFIKQGVYIGLLGSMIGAVLALVISWALKKYQFIDLPDPYFLKTLPVNFNLNVYLLIGVSAVILCILAGLYPAIIAAKVTPTDGFRDTGNAM
jgi:lipoprotein-releasing system permease protein